MFLSLTKVAIIKKTDVIILFNSTLTDLKNRPVFTLYPQGEQAGFSVFTPWGRSKKAEKPDWILICQSRIKMSFKKLKPVEIFNIKEFTTRYNTITADKL